MHSWRYYRNSFLYYAIIFGAIAAAVYAIRRPVFWPLVVILWFISLPVNHALVFAHPPRTRWLRMTDEGFQGFEHVQFKSFDGLLLSGWFWPGTNRAVLILVHGLGSSGAEMIVHGKLLAEKGFGVLLLDLRAHGYSDGDTSTYGLCEANDVAGAVDFLLEREVDSDKIGALGISLGAQAALRGALKENRVRALVLEGLGPSILEDHGDKPNSLARWINYPFNWLYYHFYYFMVGGKDKGVLDVIGEIAPRPILFIANNAKDVYFSRLFYQAANEPKELWELPNGQHGAALAQNPQEYVKRVSEFFEKALLR